MVRKDKLDEGKIERLVALLRSQAASHPPLAEDLRTEANYFENNKERIRYPTFRKLGFFVGCGVIEAGCNAECIVTPSLSPACSPVNHFDGFLVGIKVAARSDAISLSVALKRPERSFGGTTDSRASSFTDGPTRVYISVVCVFAGPSHSATFRRSFVADGNRSGVAFGMQAGCKPVVEDDNG